MFYAVIDPKKPFETKEIIDSPINSSDFGIYDLIEYNCNVLSLINGKLYIWNSEDKNWVLLNSNLINKTIITLKSRFGCLFAITDSGEIYFKETIEKNESEKDEFTFGELKFAVKQREPCPHGIKFDDQSISGVTDIDCSLTTVFIIDSEKSLWTYNREKPSMDKHGYIQVSQINFKRKVWNIFCGRSHCIALCEASDSPTTNSSILDDSEISLLSPDTSLTTGPTTSTPRRNSINPKCDECQAESSCRLSLLMKLADESALNTPTSNSNGIHASDSLASSSSTTTTPASGSATDRSVKNLQETPKIPSSSMRSKLKLEKIRFPFLKQKSPKKDLKARTVWHTASLPLGSSLGSFGSPRRRHESEDGGGVEMSAIGSSSTLPRQAPPSTITDLTGAAIFSYVNLDNFIEIGESSLSTTPDSHSQRPSISTTSNPSVGGPSSESSPIKKPTAKSDNSLTAEKFELWSWGTNAQGQLGHGDTIARREPKLIRGVSGLILKVCVGDNHNIALMASGEAYVWGSNSNGQLKQMNQSFIESPTLWRLGAESTIIDVEVGPNSTAAIVAGQSNKSLASIYHFGTDEESKIETSSTSVLNGITKIGLPFGFCSISKDFGLLIGIQKDEPENSSTKENYLKLLTVTEAVKFASQLNSLTPKLVHSSKDSESKALLLNLSEKVKAWAQLLSRLASNCLKAFSKYGNLNITSGEKNCCHFKDLCKTLLELHFAFIEAVSFRCFSDIKLDDDLLFQIDKLCLENNTESSQQQKRLKYLFELPFQQFKRLRNVASTFFWFKKNDRS
uniref:Uncharacterized protein n=1 Tax=Panagrolaimus sp. PS1159 TaxID=55785 RepID=A0AC35G286_9BILA